MDEMVLPRLGGWKRAIETGGSIMFHAPYYDGRNSLGQPTVNCDIGDVNLDGLNSYYTEIVGKEAGDRLKELRKVL